MSLEFDAAQELLGSMVFNPKLGTLMGLLMTAACIDVKSNRIPNWLVFSGAVFGVLYNSLFPDFPADTGFFTALQGLAVGLGMLLPMYMLRAMGAGDVKLMAMVGSLLGPTGAFNAALATLVAGGVMAVAYAACTGRIFLMFRNTFMIFRGAAFDLTLGMRPVMAADASVSAGKLPYGVAIASGTISYLVLKQLGII